MSQHEVGVLEPVAIRDVWPTEPGHFTPWLQAHIGELDNVLGLGLTNPQREVGAGDFSIDLVAETNVGDVVIENQFGSSDHRHLGQLVTYLSHREVQRAIWIVEDGRPEHVKAVQILNERGVGQIWLVTVRAIRIGTSPPAALFTVLAQPSDDGDEVDPAELTPTQVKRRDFMAALFAQASDEDIGSPFKHLAPSIHGILHRHARGRGLLYRVAVNRRESRVVLSNARDKWPGALQVLLKNRAAIDKAFAEADDGLKQGLQWPEQLTAGRWAIRYTVAVTYEGAPDSDKMRELNRASAAMYKVFDPYLQKLDHRLETVEDLSDQLTE